MSYPLPDAFVDDLDFCLDCDFAVRSTLDGDVVYLIGDLYEIAGFANGLCDLTSMPRFVRRDGRTVVMVRRRAYVGRAA